MDAAFCLKHFTEPLNQVSAPMPAARSPVVLAAGLASLVARHRRRDPAIWPGRDHYLGLFVADHLLEIDR